VQKLHKMLLLAIVLASTAASIVWALPLAMCSQVNQVSSTTIASHNNTRSCITGSHSCSTVKHHYNSQTSTYRVSPLGDGNVEIALPHAPYGSAPILDRKSNTQYSVRRLLHAGRMLTVTVAYKSRVILQNPLISASNPILAAICDIPLNRGPTSI